jgi:hypothetical protein
MGNCASHETDSLVQETYKKEDVQLRVDLMTTIEKHLKDLEVLIQDLHKEDVHFRMTRLIFIMNATQKLAPLIKKVEESHGADLQAVKQHFDNAFNSIPTNDRDKFQKSYENIQDFFIKLYSKTPAESH